MKVGDKLAFCCGSHSQWWEIHPITKITPSGRIVCGRWTLNPDLTIRGHSGWHGPYKGERVSEDIKEEVLRRQCLKEINGHRFETLTTHQLKQIVNVLMKKREP